MTSGTTSRSLRCLRDRHRTLPHRAVCTASSTFTRLPNWLVEVLASQFTTFYLFSRLFDTCSVPSNYLCTGLIQVRSGSGEQDESETPKKRANPHDADFGAVCNPARCHAGHPERKTFANHPA